MLEMIGRREGGAPDRSASDKWEIKMFLESREPRNRTRSLTGCVGLVFCLSLGWSFAAAQAQNDLVIVRDSATGRITAVTANGGGPIPFITAPAIVGSGAEQFLSERGGLFGIVDPDNQLMIQKSEVDSLGQTHRTYQQIHEGLPVFSGIFKLHQDANGRVLAANGDFYEISPKLNTTPAILLDQAVALCTALSRSQAPILTQSELVIVDPAWYGDPRRGVRLAYHLILSDPVEPIRDAFFVDAHTGGLLDKWSLVESAKNRQIYDGNQTTSLPGTLSRSEGQGPVAQADVNRAYDYYGDTYDYFFRAFGRDSIDGLGLPMVATVQYFSNNVCPNAFWDGSLLQMVFCPGTVTDDIVGHELTHGVTEFTAGLIYQNQSGQINEAMSDIFGELIDLFNGDAAFAGTPGGTPWPSHATGPGVDTPNNLRTACSGNPTNANGVRWLLGEDSVAFGGSIRDMWNPACRGDPDRANSPNQTCLWFDSGGVHFGSGVVNHAFAIMTDGKTFNGQNVAGIGPIKSGAVMYRALTKYLTVASDFEDLYWAANQAATDLIGTSPNDPRTGSAGSMFTAADAAEVNKALLAVEMNTPGRCGQSRNVLNSAPPPSCSQPGADIFTENFEAGLGTWTTALTGTPGTPYNWIATTQPLPFARPGKAAFCDNLNSSCQSNNTAIHSLISPVINIPMGGMHFPILSFTHYMSSEPDFDGGRIQARVNGGTWQPLNAIALFYNGYNDRLLTAQQGNTNPFAGLSAFTGSGGQWGTTLVDLSSILQNATTLQVRFDFGKDQCSGIDGWYVDDVRLFDCTSARDCNNNSIPDEFETEGGPGRDVFLDNDSVHSDGQVSDADNDGFGVQTLAQRFNLQIPKTIRIVKLSGFYAGGSPAATDNFRVIFRSDSSTGAPSSQLSSQSSVPSTRVASGFFTVFNEQEFDYTLTLPTPVPLNAGSYWVEIFNNTTTSGSTFYWTFGSSTYEQDYIAAAGQAPGTTWISGLPWNLALELQGDFLGVDADADNVPDDCDNCLGITNFDQIDMDGDGAGDACDGCEFDPNKTEPGVCGCGFPDSDPDNDLIAVCVDNCPDVANANQLDSDGDGLGDACDGCPTDPTRTVPGLCGCNLADDPTDLDTDGVADCIDNCPGVPNPDQAPGLLQGVGAACDDELDCNGNNILDTDDLISGFSKDCNANGVNDECEPEVLGPNALPVIQIAPGEIAPLSGLDVFHGGIPPFTYDWTLRGQPGGERSLSANPSFGPVPEGTYVARVVATDALGCSAMAFLTIQVGDGNPDGSPQVIGGQQCGQAMCAASSGASLLGLFVGCCCLKRVVRRRRFP
ncbi:hypothetical protein B7486_11495 [cyanobacterium TDX16]|nr:hypothetical protein B7486_11495 [cyanobacterium TDX16]